MSHVVSFAIEIHDLESAKKACAELGLVFKEGQKKYEWYGRWVNDYDAADAAYKFGLKPEDYGKCDHAIGVPGSNYEIGLVHNQETGGFKVIFDFYGTHGRAIQHAIGTNGEKLIQYYGLNKMAAGCAKKGLKTERITGDKGQVHLKISGNL